MELSEDMLDDLLKKILESLADPLYKALCTSIDMSIRDSEIVGLTRHQMLDLLHKCEKSEFKNVVILITTMCRCLAGAADVMKNFEEENRILRNSLAMVQ